MDDLFYIDTKGSADIQCTTATTAREFTVSTSNSARRQGPTSQAAQPSIEIISDDITAPATATTANNPKGSGRKGKQKAKGLDLQFLQLEVSEGSTKGKKKNSFRSKNRAAENKDKNARSSNASRKERRMPPLRQQDSLDAQDCMGDFIANLGEDGLEELLSAAVGSGFMEREIGGGMDYNYRANKSTSKNATSSYDENYDGDDGRFQIENPLEDDMEIMDEILQSSEDELHTGSAFYNSSGYDEDDGFPCSIDPECLPGPDRSPRNRKQSGGHSGISQNKRKPKENKAQAKNKASDRDGPSPGFDPYRVLKRLDMLARSDDMSSLWMEPMNRHERQIVHIFAREYGIKSKSYGSGTRRAPVLTATQNTQIPRQRRRINRILTLFDNGGLIPEEFIGGQNNQASSSNSSTGKGKKPNGRRAKGSGGVPSDTSHGKMVAENAPAVGSSNIGHKMLEQMGWQPGTGLGAQEKGRAMPVDVMIRGGRRGLGA
ncbi:squalene synthetase-like protein [Coemansia sp. RSA 1813]|nr:squalene synthetase-like protein [Coemansia sp. RSA 1646]KAJ1772425.1 squalene synthetase-like protein [Coemansia sp. RSA 1843]KAJ2213601.1 squalene synthetase-like protein [Coemansia sp. RSA 487]KAJ2571132.1 squalene synthetase-like protein [Coemansia sp. RSA 1813]